MPLQQLFGGAIQADYPSNLTDASDLRQVPDTQEVFMSNDLDLSLILEVLELVQEEGAGNDLDAAIRYHFTSLAHDNSAFSSTISSIVLPSSTQTSSEQSSAPSQSSLPSVIGPITITGIQRVAKFNKPESEADDVLVQLALWRVPSKNTDLVLTVNYPLQTPPAAGHANGTTNGGTPVHGGDDAGWRLATEAFNQAVRTLNIIDFGLFAG